MSTQVLVLAKEPVAGRVKTRLCPPCTPTQAALIATAAIDDTLAVADLFPGTRVLVVDGALPHRPGWTIVPQCGGGLDVRLAHAFVSTARPGVASILIGMDTPQVTPALLAQARDALDRADAALGLAVDGGWWILALRDPADAMALLDIPTSRDDTGRRTLEALQRRGLSVALLPELRDVDTAEDALAIAASHPDGRFATAVRAVLFSEALR
jgi:glycosyltransferase A (GT-A) superfamily protein (DUF2064 family)